jgi:hypothetical protein
LELFSLEREGRPVAGRPFHLFLSLRSTHRYSAFVFLTISAPDASRSAAKGLAAPILNRILALRSTPLQCIYLFELFLLLMQAARHASRPRGMAIWTKFVESDSKLAWAFFILPPNPSTSRKLLPYCAG